MRRVRSREQISNSQAQPPPSPAPLSTSLAAPGNTSPTHLSPSSANSQRVSGMSPATTTMIMALTGGGAGQGGGGSLPLNSPNSTGTGGHRRSGSGGGSSKERLPDEYTSLQERRHSIGEASAVSRALSGLSGREGATNMEISASRSSQQQIVLAASPHGHSGMSSHSRRASTGMTFGVSGAGTGDSYKESSIPVDRSLLNASQRAPEGDDAGKKGSAPEGDVDMSDDFVLIEQSAGHPWRALDNDYNNVRSSKQYVATSPQDSSPKPTSAHAQWYGNASGIATGGNIGGSGNVGSSQDSEMMQFSWVAHRCSYMVNIVTAMTSIADAMVREILHRQHRAQSRHVTDGTGDDRSDRSGSSGGGSTSVTRGRAASEGSLSEQLVPAFAVYLHAVGFMQDTIQRTLAAGKSIHNDSSLQGQIDSLLEVIKLFLVVTLSTVMTICHYLQQSLAKRFDQLLKRADSCKKWLSEEDVVPIPEPIIYKAALAMGQEASVEELLGNLSK